MIKRIRQLLDAPNFLPSAVRTSDGREYVVATRDHAAVRVNDTRLYIFLDDEKDVQISALHLAAVVENVQVENSASR